MTDDVLAAHGTGHCQDVADSCEDGKGAWLAN